MSLPFLRIAERTRETEEKRQALENSLRNLKEVVREKTSPLMLIKEHPKLLLGAVLSGLSALKITKGVVASRSGKNGTKSGDRGLWMKLISFLGMVGIKFLAPMAVSTVQKALTRRKK